MTDQQQPQQPQPYPLPTAPTDLATIKSLDASLTFPTFTSSTAWDLGRALRRNLLTHPQPACVSITLANGTPLFYSTTHPGCTPDNTAWVQRKQRTVLRFGVSTWFMSRKFSGDEGAFAAKYGLGERGGDYAIHGGGWPVRVEGVEGVVAVVVVSGLSQDKDHMVVVQTVRDFLGKDADVLLDEGEKRKED